MKYKILFIEEGRYLCPTSPLFSKDTVNGLFRHGNTAFILSGDIKIILSEHKELFEIIEVNE